MNGDTNLALNKPASQASTYDTAVASKAVDGHSDTLSCTNGHVHPWWTVDLGAAYDIGHITVTNYDNPLHGNCNFIAMSGYCHDMLSVHLSLSVSYAGVL